MPRDYGGPVSTTTPDPATAAGPTTPARVPDRPAGRSPRWLGRLAWANLVAQIGIIVTGGAVRLTGSGLGCSTWPQCEPGRFTPEFHAATPAHAYIEFGNRTLTGVLGVIALALAIAAWRSHALPAWYRRTALLPVVGVAVQAAIGGATVLAKLHPAVVGLHMLVSLLLVAASTVLVARRPGAAPRALVGQTAGRVAEATVMVGLVLMVAGIVTTGAGPHGGDAEYAYRYAVDPVLVARLHAGTAWVFVGLVATCVWAMRRDGAVARPGIRPWYALLGVTLAQGLIGYVQYFTGLPELIVGAHLLGTGVLAAALTWARSGIRPPAALTPLI